MVGSPKLYDYTTWLSNFYSTFYSITQVTPRRPRIIASKEGFEPGIAASTVWSYFQYIYNLKP